MVDGARLESVYTGDRIAGSNPAPSATCPRESVLPIRLRPDFSVVLEGYAGGAVNWPCCAEGRKLSLKADILQSRQLDRYWFRVAILCFYSIIRRYRTVSALSSVWPLLRLRSNCIKLLLTDSHK